MVWGHYREPTPAWQLSIAKRTKGCVSTFALLTLGTVSWYQGDSLAAERELAESLVLAEATGDRWMQAAVLFGAAGDISRHVGCCVFCNLLQQLVRAEKPDVGPRPASCHPSY
jgi:hypothetical protein